MTETNSNVIKVERSRSGGELVFDKQSFIVAAPTKLGKSTLFSHPKAKALYFDADNTLSHLDVERIEVPEWDVFASVDWWRGAVAAIKEFAPRFLVIDTASTLYDNCEYAVCQRAGLTSPSGADEQANKFYDQSAREFWAAMSRFLRGSMGVVFLTHAEVKNVKMQVKTKLADGKEIVKSVKMDRLVPKIRPGALRFLEPKVHNQFHIGFRSVENEDDVACERSLFTRATPLYQGGCRLSPDELPSEIVLPADVPENGFLVLEEAWENAIKIHNSKKGVK